jgi:hypothetical protein
LQVKLYGLHRVRTIAKRSSARGVYNNNMDLSARESPEFSVPTVLCYRSVYLY